MNGSFFQAIALNDIPSQDNLTQINRLNSFGTTYLLNYIMAKNTNKSMVNLNESHFWKVAGGTRRFGLGSRGVFHAKKSPRHMVGEPNVIFRKIKLETFLIHGSSIYLEHHRFAVASADGHSYRLGDDDVERTLSLDPNPQLPINRRRHRRIGAVDVPINHLRTGGHLFLFVRLNR